MILSAPDRRRCRRRSSKWQRDRCTTNISNYVLEEVPTGDANAVVLVVEVWKELLFPRLGAQDQWATLGHSSIEMAALDPSVLLQIE